MIRAFVGRMALIAIVGVAIIVTLSGCSGKPCYIHGTMESRAWDGKRIFLVPMEGPRDAAHVDSVVIRDRAFEFTVHKEEMKIVRLDYHFRRGTQDLLIVTESGDLYVSIGENSVAAGTPQNDSMQVWKDHVMMCTRQCAELRKRGKETGEDVKDQVKEIQRRNRQFTRLMADRMPEGVFKDYLNKYYPSRDESRD